MADSVDISTRLCSLKNQLYKWLDETDAMVVDLEKLANNLDEHFSNISKAKVGGGTAAVVGGILSAAGFGLSFFTFGSSLSLVVAGGLIGGTGSLVVGGSQITDAVLSRNREDTAENILHKYKFRIESMMKECVEIGELLNDQGDVDTNFPSWVRFWKTIVMNSGVKNIAWDMIKNTVESYLILAAKAGKDLEMGGEVAATAFKAIGTTAGQALHVAGGVMGMVFLPFDILTLVDSSIDVHNDSHNETSGKIRKMAAEIKKGRPTKKDIEKMVNETVSKIASLTKCR